mgnify:CR=1 FL=1
MEKYTDYMIEIFASDLVEPLTEYIKATNRCDNGEGHSLKDGDKRYKKMTELAQSKYTGKEVTMDIVEYWRSIAKAKIELIGRFGGKDLAREIYSKLEKNPHPAEYNLARAFEVLATNVIEGWYF